MRPRNHRKRVNAGQNRDRREGLSLAQANPALVREWHSTRNEDLNPTILAPNSNKKVWWICGQGHEWRATIANRNYNKSGCPFCVGKRVCLENSLALVNSEVARQWHPTKNGTLTPLDVTRSSHRVVWWLCSKNHEWQISVNQRNSGKRSTGCPFCSGSQLTQENSLAVNYPAIALQWHSTKNGSATPQSVSKYSHKTIWWICGRGHEWSATVANRTHNSSGCPR